MIGLYVLAASLAVALAYGIVSRRRSGVVRRGRADAAAVTAAELGLPALGERATLVQFSSAFCAPCRATRVVLSDVAARSPGVLHVDVDAEGALELVRRLGIMRTPTTLVVDAGGRVVGRAGGVPKREQVEAALTPLAADANRYLG